MNLASPGISISPSSVSELPERAIATSRQQILAQARATPGMIFIFCILLSTHPFPESHTLDVVGDEDQSLQTSSPHAYEDIDAPDGNDPLLCTAYVQEVYEYLRISEV